MKSERLKLGEDFMVAGHRSIGQTRKDGKRLYEIHPFAVRDRLLTVTDDEDMQLIALFHDLEEDVETSDKRRNLNPQEIAYFGLNPNITWRFNILTIAALFGDRVAIGVEYLTDEFTSKSYPEFNRKTRKQMQREKYVFMPDNEKVIKLCDICENLSDDGGEFSDSFGGPDVGFNIMYIKEKALCLPFLEVKDDPRNAQLYKLAWEVWHKQAVKFGVRQCGVR